MGWRIFSRILSHILRILKKNLDTLGPGESGIVKGVLSTASAPLSCVSVQLCPLRPPPSRPPLRQRVQTLAGGGSGDPPGGGHVLLGGGGAPTGGHCGRVCIHLLDHNGEHARTPRWRWRRRPSARFPVPGRRVQAGGGSWDPPGGGHVLLEGGGPPAGGYHGRVCIHLLHHNGEHEWAKG